MNWSDIYNGIRVSRLRTECTSSREGGQGHTGCVRVFVNWRVNTVGLVPRRLTIDRRECRMIRLCSLSGEREMRSVWMSIKARRRMREVDNHSVIFESPSCGHSLYTFHTLPMDMQQRVYYYYFIYLMPIYMLGVQSTCEHVSGGFARAVYLAKTARLNSRSPKLGEKRHKIRSKQFETTQTYANYADTIHNSSTVRHQTRYNGRQTIRINCPRRPPAPKQETRAAAH